MVTGQTLNLMNLAIFIILVLLQMALIRLAFLFIKKEIADPTIRIGADDFLKFGTIIKLKVLMGKVYFALNGKKTGFDKYQLSVLKQQ